MSRLASSPSSPIFSVQPASVAATEKKTRKRARKTPKVKDPNAPKRPPSSYLEFQKAVIDDFREQYPELKYQHVMKKIGAAWQGMTDEEKQVRRLFISLFTPSPPL
jgi:hypothetical protein